MSSTDMYGGRGKKPDTAAVEGTRLAPSGTVDDPRLVEASLTRRALLDFISRQRWFRSKARTLIDAKLVDIGLLGAGGFMAVVAVTFEDGGVDRYAFAGGGEGALLRMLLTGGSLPMRTGRVEATTLGAADPGFAADDVGQGAPDQSNTSIVFGSAYIMKMFRKLEVGVNPDVEIGRFLSARGFTRVPPLAAAAEYVAEDGSRSSILMLQELVPNQGNAWDFTLAALRPDAAQGFAPSPEYLAFANRLGQRTGELHVALASDPDEPDFAPESCSRRDLAVLSNRMREYGSAQIDLLQSASQPLHPNARQDAADVFDARMQLLDRFKHLERVQHPGFQIRCHGDYHLGQTLVADGDFIILDFEGEPARSLAERRAKSSPLRDVAGMVRSFGYAASAGLKASPRAAAPGAFAGLERWERAVRGAFIDGYLSAAADGGFLPPRRQDFETMLEAFVLEKALYELGYELNNRPDWVGVPLAALKRLAAGERVS